MQDGNDEVDGLWTDTEGSVDVSFLRITLGDPATSGGETRGMGSKLYSVQCFLNPINEPVV
jgi:hypothetical protein